MSSPTGRASTPPENDYTRIRDTRVHGEVARNIAQAEAERLMWGMSPETRATFLNRLIMADPFKAHDIARKLRAEGTDG